MVWDSDCWSRGEAPASSLKGLETIKRQVKVRVSFFIIGVMF